MIVGNNFSCNKNCCFSSDSLIEIGDDVLLGWNCDIRTSDGHSIYYRDDVLKMKINKSKSISIGNHVWICANASLLKGSRIPDACVVASNAIVTSELSTKNSIYGGCPSKMIKSNIDWEI